MRTLTSSPSALRLFAASVLARLPMAMFSIGLLVHAEHVTGSYTAAGLVTAAYAVATGASAPLLGRLVDRCGQSGALVGGALVAGAAVTAIALLPAGAPLAMLVALAAVLGVSVPPVGACVRVLLPDVLEDPAAVHAAYAAESAAIELTWISGPPLVLAVGAAWSTSAALALAGAVLVVATALFALQPASRAWRPALSAPRPRGGSLATPAMRTLVAVLLASGVVFGAVEVAVTAAADGLGSSAAAGPLLGVWGAGSLIGGLIAARAGGGARTGAGLALVLTGLAAAHLALAAAAGSAIALAAVLALAGATIAPTYATIYAMVDGAAPDGTVTEAFAWLNTAVAIGAALGAATAGAVADATGPVPTFVLAGAAGAAAAIIAALRARPLTRPATALA